MSPRIPMKTRNVRVSDRVWAAAQKAADERGENLSEEIRAHLAKYAGVSKVPTRSRTVNHEDELRDAIREAIDKNVYGVVAGDPEDDWVETEGLDAATDAVLAILKARGQGK